MRLQTQVENAISPRLQRVLDAFTVSPAFIKSLMWDLVAWNRAAAAVFGYDALKKNERNILRRIFCSPAARAANPHWEAVARFAVAAFRADVARAGPSAEIDSVVDALSADSPEFAAMWLDTDVRSWGDGVKNLDHPEAGIISMEFSSFAVDGRPDLGLVIYNPVTAADADKVRALL